MVGVGELNGLRNQSGAIYGACGTCDSGNISEVGSVYITPTGGSYHMSLGCGGLKRTISSVLLEELIGKGACQRCG